MGALSLHFSCTVCPALGLSGFTQRLEFCAGRALVQKWQRFSVAPDCWRKSLMCNIPEGISPVIFAWTDHKQLWNIAHNSKQWKMCIGIHLEAVDGVVLLNVILACGGFISACVIDTCSNQYRLYLPVQSRITHSPPPNCTLPSQPSQQQQNNHYNQKYYQKHH